MANSPGFVAYLADARRRQRMWFRFYEGIIVVLSLAALVISIGYYLASDENVRIQPWNPRSDSAADTFEKEAVTERGR